jgi:hypothetical protein
MGHMGVRKTSTCNQIMQNFAESSLLHSEHVEGNIPVDQRILTRLQEVLAFDEATGTYCPVYTFLTLKANNKRLLIFIDNLDKMDDNKDSNIQEYLRFSLANAGFWKSNVFRRTSNVNWIASLDVSSTSILENNSLSPRIMRHFNVFYLPEDDYIDFELGLEFRGQLSSVSDDLGAFLKN